jgi:hypothetical protein
VTEIVCAPISIQVLRSSLKKTLGSSQNIENKRLEFFLPSRSMVLNVLTGKILKTCKLLVILGPHGSILELRKYKLGRASPQLIAVRAARLSRRKLRLCQIVKDPLLNDQLFNDQLSNDR